jgi:pyrroline-5-carboxylate reductase
MAYIAFRKGGISMAEFARTRIGFLGAGQMASALARGWTAAGLIAPEDGLAGDPSPEARSSFTQRCGWKAVPSNRDVVVDSDVLVLAVKPQVMSAVIADVRPLVKARHLLISVAAGVTLQKLAEELGNDCRLIRVMPNTPCLVGASAAGYSPSRSATAEDIDLVDRLFNAVGKAYRLPEHLLDAVTGLSGSGPAFVYVMIEALSDGGVRMGLPRDVATGLAAQTVLGAARMVVDTGLHTGQLKDMVTSPGGTTIAGLHALERGGLRAALIDAVEAATRRATELGT